MWTGGHFVYMPTGREEKNSQATQHPERHGAWRWNDTKMTTGTLSQDFLPLAGPHQMYLSFFNESCNDPQYNWSMLSTNASISKNYFYKLKKRKPILLASF